MSPPTRTAPSLRIAELAITNFRTFRERTQIPFRDSEGAPADAVATFHGDNGSGKSNALAALDLFFTAYPYAIEHPGLRVPWDEGFHPSPRRPPLIVRYHDRPTGEADVTEIEVTFVDGRLGRRRLQLVPSGQSVRIESDVREGEDRDALLTWLSAPLGADSRPVALLDARRRPAWLKDAPGSVAASWEEPLFALVWHLFALRSSKHAEKRERWRAFVETLGRFPAFVGKEITVDRPVDRDGADLFFEERRRLILSLGDLSSGERQLVALCATMFTADSAIVALEEPELSLDARNQSIFQDILREHTRSGLFDQILVESHVPAFDGPRVIRFTREEDGSTRVERAKSISPLSEDTENAARERGATQRWVTAEGYTQLPDRMREALGVGAGKHVWFMPGERRWEAWPEEDLERLFCGEPEETESEP